MTLKSVLIYGAIAFVCYFMFCYKDNSKSRSEQDDFQKSKVLKLKKQNKIDSIAKIYDAVYTDSIFEMKFTIELQNYFKKSSSILIQNFKIHDIESIDSSYIVSLKGHNYSSKSNYFCFKLKCKKELLDNFGNLNDSINEIMKDYFLIAKVEKVRKIDFSVDWDNDYDEYGHHNMELEISESLNYIFYGELIKFIKKDDTK